MTWSARRPVRRQMRGVPPARTEPVPGPRDTGGSFPDAPMSVGREALRAGTKLGEKRFEDRRQGSGRHRGGERDRAGPRPAVRSRGGEGRRGRGHPIRPARIGCERDRRSRGACDVTNGRCRPSPPPRRSVSGRSTCSAPMRGIACLGGEEAPDEEWRLNWDLHVMAHVYAARAVAPKMAARGSGYLVNTASAAGLLTHVESATYAATKPRGGRLRRVSRHRVRRPAGCGSRCSARRRCARP